jgi:hypothetical protein
MIDSPLLAFRSPLYVVPTNGQGQAYQNLFYWQPREPQ